jgi:hypothetical protein
MAFGVPQNFNTWAYIGSPPFSFPFDLPQFPHHRTLALAAALAALPQPHLAGVALASLLH